jgi:hypothetical protein
MKNYGILCRKKIKSHSPCNVVEKDLVKYMLTNK